MWTTPCVVVRRVAAPAAVVAGALLVCADRSALGDAAADAAAQKQLVATQTTVFATFRTSTSAAAKTFDADAAALEKLLAVSGDGAAAAQALFDALVKLQTSETSALTTAADGQAAAAKALLAGLAPATEGVYPAAFYPGQGTPTGTFEDAVDSLLAKSYAKLEKRAGAAMKRIERAGTHVALRLAAPRRPVRVWSSKGTDSFIAPHPTIDVLLAFRVASQATAGKMRAAGQAGFVPPGPLPFDGDVDCGAFFTATGASQEQKVTPADGRWKVDFADADFVPGVWLVGASQNLVPADASIGVR